MIASPVAVVVGGSRTAKDDPAYSTLKPIDGAAPALSAQVDQPAVPPGNSIASIPVGSIVPNSRQPRQHFDPDSLKTLADSIRTSGLMQPVVVRPTSGGYELVIGERRWRAAKAAGLTDIPAVVRALDDRTSAEWALVENLQREDLNPIERAEAFRGLQNEFGLTHQEIADQVGLTRSAVTNQIRLNDLDDGLRELVRTGSLSAGHGRTLLAITNLETRLKLARDAMRHGWSVRELERRTRQAPRTGAVAASLSQAADATRRQHEALARQLGTHLGTRVRINTGRKKGSGQLVIDFYDLDQFDGLMNRFGFTPSD
jgi:ParB family chromosome partitioning protein